MPPTTKKPRELIRYRIPIFLWSVVVSHPRSRRPLGSGRANGGAWMTAISASPLRLRVPHDEHAGHRRSVHVALEVVLAGRERRDGLGAVGHAGEFPGGEELVPGVHA